MRLKVVVVALFIGASLFEARVVPTTRAQTTGAPSCLPAAPHSTGSATTLTAADNGFGFRLLRQIASHNASSNVFISPTSIALALDMAYDGSREGTQAAMATALGLRGLSRNAVRKGAASLLGRLTSDDPQVQLQIANA